MKDDRRFDFASVNDELTSVTWKPNLWTVGATNAVKRADGEAEWLNDQCVIYYANDQVIGGSMGPNFPHDRWTEAIELVQAQL